MCRIHRLDFQMCDTMSDDVDKISVKSIEQERFKHAYLSFTNVWEIELPLLYINRIGQLMGGSLSSTDVCFEIYSKEIILGRIYVFVFLFDQFFNKTFFYVFGRYFVFIHLNIIFLSTYLLSWHRVLVSYTISCCAVRSCTLSTAVLLLFFFLDYCIYRKLRVTLLDWRHVCAHSFSFLSLL